jgi:hypothetical protein
MVHSEEDDVGEAVCWLPSFRHHLSDRRHYERARKIQFYFRKTRKHRRQLSFGNRLS